MGICSNQIVRADRADFFTGADWDGALMYATTIENGANGTAPTIDAHPSTGRSAMKFSSSAASGAAASRSIASWNLRAARHGVASDSALAGFVPSFDCVIDLTYVTADGNTPTGASAFLQCATFAGCNRTTGAGTGDLLRVGIGTSGAIAYRLQNAAKVESATTIASSAYRLLRVKYTPSSDGVASDGTLAFWISSDGGANWTAVTDLSATHILTDGMTAVEVGSRVAGGLGSGRLPVVVWQHFIAPMVPDHVTRFVGGTVTKRMIDCMLEPCAGFSFNARADWVSACTWIDPACIKYTLSGKTCDVTAEWQYNDPYTSVSIVGTQACDIASTPTNRNTGCKILGLSENSTVWVRFKFVDQADAGNIGTSRFFCTRTFPGENATGTVNFSAYGCFDDGLGHVAGSLGMLNEFDLQLRIACGDFIAYLDSSGRDNKMPTTIGEVYNVNVMGKSSIWHLLCDEPELHLPSDHQLWDSATAAARENVADKYGVNAAGTDGTSRATLCDQPDLEGLGVTQGEAWDFLAEAYYDQYSRWFYNDSWALTPGASDYYLHTALWQTFKIRGVRFVLHDTRMFWDPGGSEPTSGGRATQLGAIQEAWMDQELAPLLADSDMIEVVAEGCVSPVGLANDDEMYTTGPSLLWEFEQFYQARTRQTARIGLNEADRHNPCVHRYFTAGGWAARPIPFSKAIQCSRICPVAKGIDYRAEANPSGGSESVGVDLYSDWGFGTITSPPQFVFSAGYVAVNAATRTRTTYIYNGDTFAAVGTYSQSAGAPAGRSVARTRNFRRLVR